MKRSVLYVLLVIPFLLNAQDPDGSYNPYVNQGTISPSPLLPVEVNGTGLVSFNVGNTGSDPLEVYTDQYITLTISLSYGVPDNPDPLNAIQGTFASYFDWSYDDAGTYTGIQNTVIPAGGLGSITIDYLVTQNSQSPGLNGFNVNISPAPYQTASNTTDDDFVSSYTYTELKDFGDAPASYGSADHTIDFNNFLGAAVDGEDASIYSSLADGDDLDAQDDEDGVVFPAGIHRDETVNIQVTVSGLGYLNVWMDWNADGDFNDPGEHAANNLQRTSGLHDIPITVPPDANITTATYARFRFSSNSLSDPVGSAIGGEVEDYQLLVLCAPPTPGLAISDADSAFCEGTEVVFTATGGILYDFRVDGISVQSGSDDTFTTDTLTDGQRIDVIVTDGNSCTATSAEIEVTVFSLPDAQLSDSDADQIICEGTIVTFSASGGANYDFTVDGLTAQSGTQSDYLTDSLTDGQTVNVLVTSAEGCVSAAQGITYTVNPVPVAPDVSVTDNCDGTSLLSTTASGSLLWSTGETTQQIIVTSAGDYSVTTSVNGCTSPQNTVTAAPGVTPASPAVSDAAPENICPDTTVDLTQLITSSTPPGGSLVYKTTNDPNGDDIADPSAVVAGSYYLFYQNSDGCYSAATEVIVTINACPPDLTPTLVVSPNIMHGITDFDLVVRITELNNINTTGIITIVIPKDTRWILTDGYDPALLTLAGRDLDNNLWTYSEDVNNHIFSTNSVIPAGDFITFGFRVTFNPASTRGIYSITTQLQSGSGGEARPGNNADSESIDYFQQ